MGAVAPPPEGRGTPDRMVPTRQLDRVIAALFAGDDAALSDTQSLAAYRDLDGPERAHGGLDQRPQPSGPAAVTPGNSPGANLVAEYKNPSGVCQ